VIDRDHVADLLPCGAHVFLLVGTDDARAEAGGGAIPGIEIEPVHPIRITGSGRHALDLRVPAAIDGRRHQRIGGSSTARVRRRVEDGLQLWCEITATRKPPAHAGGRKQRTLEPNEIARRIVRLVDAKAGMRDIHVADADARIHIARNERARQRLEIAGYTGTERPFEIDRKFVGRIVPRTRRAVITVRHRLGESGLAADLERRHQKGSVAGVGIEPARRNESRVAEVGIGLQRSSELREIGTVRRARKHRVDVHVRKGPFLPGDRKDIGAARGRRRHERRQRPIGHAATGELAVAQHGEQEPGRKTMTCIRRQRRIAPGEILVIEIERDEIIRLEIADAGTRLRADDLPCLHAGDIARTDQVHGHRRQVGALRLGLGRQGDRRGRTAGPAAGDRLDLVGDASPQPRQEGIGPERHQAAPIAATAGTTWIVPASSGRSVSSACKLWSAAIGVPKLCPGECGDRSSVETMTKQSGTRVT
jgi:hypothetical protein